MKRVLSILVIAVLSLSACVPPLTTPQTETQITSPTTEQPTPVTYTLSTNVSPSGSGSVSPSSGQYIDGTQVGLIATPATGYTFDYWSGDATGSSTAVILTMDLDKSVTAHFAEVAPAPIVTPPLGEVELRVHFIDVGQGDSILIDLGEIEILIDGGGKSPGVTTYLNDYVDGQLEVLVATHPHADHIGGLIAVLNAFDVQEIWHNGDISTSQTYGQFMAAVQAEGAGIHTMRRGDEITVGELTFVILNPATLGGTINNNSIVLSLSYGEVDFLFMGDAEQEAEVSMLDAGIVTDVEILKVGHHGSRTSSSAHFIEAVKPEIAIYMAGESNRYGHPHEETIATLTSVGAKIYGTDIYGNIIVTTDGEAFSIKTEK